MKVTLSFLGATRNVTGSRFLVDVDGLRILVDCGLYQERDFQERNWDPFPVEPSSINVVLLTHAHLDHCGLLPRLVEQGFAGPIYCTEATAEITGIVLLDAAKIQEEDAEYKRKRHRREGRQGPRPEVPLYTTEQAQASLPHFKTIKYAQQVQVADGIEAGFYDAGHILGAAMIKLNIRRNGWNRSILFSGDVGRPNRPILKDPTIFEQADYVLVESTYGDRLHKNVEDTRAEFTEVINNTVRQGGNIIIPSFAVERAQEVLYYLNELLLEDRIPYIMTFLDSPMAVSVTEVFMRHTELFDREMKEHLKNHQSPFEFAGLSLIKATKESKAINQIKGTVMVIAGSGMCTGGRIKHHLVNNISRPDSTVVFVGYQAAGTLGRQIVNGEKEVRILGQNYQVKAGIARINGFSGHADRDELLGWLTGLQQRPRRVFIIHGETETAEKFKNFVAEKTGWNTTLPKFGDTIVLD